MHPPARRFGSADEAYAWIAGFINLERGQTVRSFRLDRMATLCALAGNPQDSFKSVHVAGSKGKGSVSAFIAAGIASLGARVAVYASPHVSDFRERLRLSDGALDDAVLVSEAEGLSGIVASLPGGMLPGEEAPTFFELMTLWAFMAFRKAGVEWAVLETGMGGRLDSTNVVRPALSVLTPIELEHVEYLGDSIELIAGEKAGIIKPGATVVSGAQRPEALAVFKAAAAAARSRLVLAPEKGTARVAGRDSRRDLVECSLDGKGSFRFPLALRGDIQAQNALVALVALGELFPEADPVALAAAFGRVSLPARFELFEGDPDVVLDGAHTEGSVGHCVATFCAVYPGERTLLFACAADKNVEAMARVAADRFSRIIVTRTGAGKKSDPERAMRAFSSAKPGCTVGIVEDPAAALAEAMSLGKPLLACGSFYLAAAIRDGLIAGKLR